jgi:hypothetical protein
MRDIGYTPAGEHVLHFPDQVAEEDDVALPIHPGTPHLAWMLEQVAQRSRVNSERLLLGCKD